MPRELCMRFSLLTALIVFALTAPVVANPAEGSNSVAKDEPVHIERDLAVA
jgi:hypothetical protein